MKELKISIDESKTAPLLQTVISNVSTPTRVDSVQTVASDIPGEKNIFSKSNSSLGPGISTKPTLGTLQPLSGSPTSKALGGGRSPLSSPEGPSAASKVSLEKLNKSTPSTISSPVDAKDTRSRSGLLNPLPSSRQNQPSTKYSDEKSQADELEQSTQSIESEFSTYADSAPNSAPNSPSVPKQPHTSTHFSTDTSDITKTVPYDISKHTSGDSPKHIPGDGPKHIPGDSSNHMCMFICVYICLF